MLVVNQASLQDLQQRLPSAGPPTAATGAAATGRGAGAHITAGARGAPDPAPPPAAADGSMDTLPSKSGRDSRGSKTATLQPGTPNTHVPPAVAEASGTEADVLDIRRFRPNLLVAGGVGAAFAEDGWRGVRIGPLQFDVAGAPSAPAYRLPFVCHMTCLHAS